MSKSYIPNLGAYNNIGTFPYWCSKVLPTVYDDSLSYYELLCKVVNSLNELIKNHDTTIANIKELYDAFVSLKEYVDEYFDNIDDSLIKEVVDKWLEEHPEVANYYVTPKMFGAKGDGVNDDSDAIQQAVNVSNNILFDGGVYLITKTIKIPSNRKIEFISGAKVLLGENANVHMVENEDANGNERISIHNAIFDINENNKNSNLMPTSFARFYKCTGVELSNCRFVGYGVISVYSDVGAVYFSECENCIILECEITGAPTEGLVLHRCKSCVVKGGVYSHCKNGSGVALSGEYNTLIDVVCHTNDGSNFSINGPYSTLIGCVSYNGTGNNGLTFGHHNSPADYSTAIGCILRNNVNGIYIGTSKNVKIESCTIIGTDKDGAENYGILVGSDTNNCTFIGNNISNCLDGIYINRGASAVGNYVHDNSGRGIHSPFSKDCSIVNNVVTNNTVGIFTGDEAQNTFISGNHCYNDTTNEHKYTQLIGIYSLGNSIILNNYCHGHSESDYSVVGSDITNGNVNSNGLL